MKTKREKRRIAVKVIRSLSWLICIGGFLVSLAFTGWINDGTIEPTIFGVLSWELVVSLLVTGFGIYLYVDTYKTENKFREKNKWF